MKTFPLVSLLGVGLNTVQAKLGKPTTKDGSWTFYPNVRGSKTMVVNVRDAKVKQLILILKSDPTSKSLSDLFRTPMTAKNPETEDGNSWFKFDQVISCTVPDNPKLKLPMDKYVSVSAAHVTGLFDTKMCSQFGVAPGDWIVNCKLESIG